MMGVRTYDFGNGVKVLAHPTAYHSMAQRFSTREKAEAALHEVRLNGIRSLILEDGGHFYVEIEPRNELKSPEQNNCDGGGPHRPGEVRVYPIGGGGNLILCQACWAHEVGFEIERLRAARVPNSEWNLLKWEDAQVYKGDE